MSILHRIQLGFRVAMSLLVVCLLGCNEVTVLEDQRQSDARRAAAILADHQIESSVVRAGHAKGLFAVTVPGEFEARAAQVLHDAGLPRDDAHTFAELTASSAFAPASREVEVLRAERARALEFEELLRTHPGIEQVAVVVHGATGARRSDVPAVVVVAVTSADAEEAQQIERFITDTAQHVIAGVTADKVKVSVVRRAPRAMAATRVVDESSRKTVLVAIVGLACLVLGVVVGILVMRARTAVLRGGKSAR